MKIDRQKLMRLGLVAAAAIVLVLLIAITAKRDPHRAAAPADRLVGLWRKASGPGYKNVLRLSPSGAFSQAFLPDGESIQRQWHGTWAVENDSLLVYCTPEPASLMDDWMNELQLAWAGPESFEILNLSESSLTIKTDDGPMAFDKVPNDPAFPKTAQ